MRASSLTPIRRPLGLARALTVTLVFGLSLTACGDKEPAKSSGGEAGNSAPKHSSAKALTKDNFSGRVFTALEKAGSAKVHFESGAAGQQVKGDGEIKYGDELALRVKMDMPQATGAPQELIMVGKTFYIGMGEHYMSMPLDAFKSMGVPDVSTNLDPRIQAKAFDKALTSFKQVGEPEQLDGVSATPYEVTVDPTKAPDVFGSAVTDPITVVYYIGPDDLLRKMVYQDKNGEFVTTYTDWGAPVNIEAPAKADSMPGMG